jgi:hypothetical protein
MKPCWENAPRWANYLAQDSDGSWWWHENKPEISGVDDHHGEWESSGGQIDIAEPCGENWHDSLEERPTMVHEGALRNEPI